MILLKSGLLHTVDDGRLAPYSMLYHTIQHIRPLYACVVVSKVTCRVQAANAGGVAVSGLEMAQNAMRLQWTREEVDEKLKVTLLGNVVLACGRYHSWMVWYSHSTCTNIHLAFARVPWCLPGTQQ